MEKATVVNTNGIDQCPKCGAIVPPARAIQEADNNWYRKRDCLGCGTVFEMTQHKSAKTAATRTI